MPIRNDGDLKQHSVSTYEKKKHLKTLFSIYASAPAGAVAVVGCVNDRLVSATNELL